MRAIRTFGLLLFALAPALALAQGPDSVHVRVSGVEYPGYGASFGPQFLLGRSLGPLPLVPVAGDGTTAPAEQGCDPFVNADEVQGNIAMVLRGTCAFVVKVQNAAAAGAAAVIVYNDDRDGDDSEALAQMGGNCGGAEGCTIPAAFVSRASGLAILSEPVPPIIASVILICHCVPGPPPLIGTHDTGVVQFDVFDHGFLGRYATFSGTGFVFNGVNGLFVSTVLVGIDGDVVTNPFGRGSARMEGAEVEPIAAALPVPDGDFDQVFEAEYEHADLGVRVTQRSYSRAGDPYVIVELEVANISGSDIEEAYIGLFADFDVGALHTDDAAGIAEDLSLLYVYDPNEVGPYFGIVALTPVGLSGYSTVATVADDAQLFAALTSEIEIAATPADRAVVVGTGPFDLPAGADSFARFAFLGGADEQALIATAGEIRLGGLSIAEATTPEGTFVLGSAYPNPFAQGTTIPFDLPTAQDVRLAVYDVLGREVAVLVDGPRSAGEQAVTLDASALPSGVYLVRLDAGATRLVQRVTVVR